MAICYLGIGSNLGNRKKNMKLAIKKVNLLKNTRIIKGSRFIDSLPVGGIKDQPNYLNAVLKIQTKISPSDLLKKLKKIELQLGRIPARRFGPRVIDLDILLYADRVMRTKRLTIPHPRMFVRDFVIKSLREVL